MRARVTPFAIGCFFLLLVAASWPRSAQAWHPDHHAILTERGLIGIAAANDLNTPVIITEYRQFLRKVAPIVGIAPTPEAFSRYLQVNPVVDIATMGEYEAEGMRWTPLKILTMHTADPDDGRDAGVVRKPEAKYLGGSASQAFRHYDKPPFRWRRWRTTLGYPFREIGEASVRAQIYFDLARLAWQVDEPYWAWRWLACSLHYLQDLSQPYHTTQDASHGRYTMAALRVLLQTRFRRGPIDTMVQLLSNSHLFYEDLAVFHTRIAIEGRPRDARAAWLLEALAGRAGSVVRTVRAYAKIVRDRSNERAADLLQAVYRMSGHRLLSLYEYPQPGDYPELFLNNRRDLDFLAAEKQYFTLTRAAVQQTAQSTRNLVVTFAAARDTISPAALAVTLRTLLAE